MLKKIENRRCEIAIWKNVSVIGADGEDAQGVMNLVRHNVSIVHVSCFRDIFENEVRPEWLHLRIFYFDKVDSEIDRKWPLINFQKEIDSSQ